jgi:hypothetical protein
MTRSISRSCQRAMLAGALIALAGCVVYEEPVPVYESQPVHIPPGHLPPPGQCRIWYPDRPPGTSRRRGRAASCGTRCRRALCWCRASASARDPSLQCQATGASRTATAQHTMRTPRLNRRNLRATIRTFTATSRARSLREASLAPLPGSGQ